jgi:hypothetical protein
MNPYCRLIHLEICSESLNLVWCHFQQSNIQRSSLGIDRWIRIRVIQMLSDLSPNKSNTMMSLVGQELLVFPTFTPAVSNVQSLVFSSIFGCSLFVFFVFWPLHYRFLFNLQLLMSPFISSNVFLQSSWHYFNWKLLKYSDVAVRGVTIGLRIPSKWQPSPLKPSIHPYVQCPFCLSHILLVHVIQWESQLRPYLPVMQPEETSKENYVRWHWYRVSVMAFISQISWRWDLLVAETGVLGKNQWPVASHWQT